MIAWKWSNGEGHHKSERRESSPTVATNNVSYDTRQNAISQSLDDNIDSDLMTITNSMFSQNQQSAGNKRESLDEKISGRQLVPQRGVNPFMQQSSYVNDIVTRDMFLKPLNTSLEREIEKIEPKPDYD